MVTAFVRTILLYFIIMLGLRLMGKRQIGELEPTELVLTMLISDLAAVPMQDFGIPLLNGVIPIVTLLLLSMLLSWGSVRSIRLRRLICGSPTALILDGKVQQDAMRHNRFTLDELIEELRLMPCRPVREAGTRALMSIRIRHIRFDVINRRAVHKVRARDNDCRPFGTIQVNVNDFG